MNPVLQFIDAINAHNPQRIIRLMTEDHVFIDTHDNHQSKEEMKTGWPGYFEWFPDYLIEVEQIMEDGDTFGVFGYASGTHAKTGKHWRLPAVWRAIIENDKVKVWQVYCDSKIPYESME